MKTIKALLSALLITICSSTIYAQSDPINSLFDKYADKDGYTTVYVSGKMLQLLSQFGTDPSSRSVLANTSSIKILTSDRPGNNFYDELKQKSVFDKYEELMTVKEAGETTNIYVKYNNAEEQNISDFVMINSTNDSNVLISITGNINLRDLSKLSGTLGMDELSPLEDVEF